MRPLLVLVIVTVGFAPALHAQSTKSEKAFQHDIQSYQLNHSRADEIVEILNEQFPSSLKFSGNSLTNTIYVRVPQGIAAEVREFIDRLEADAVEKAENLKRKIENKAAVEQQRLRSHVGRKEHGRRETYEILFPRDPNTKAAETQIKQTNVTRNKASKRITRQADTFGDVDLFVTNREADILRSTYEAAEREAAKLADRWRRENAKGKLPNGEMQKLRALVAKHVTSAFDLRQQMKQNDVAKAAAQLQRIRERIDQRRQIVDQIVERRVEDLLGNVDLSWLSAQDRAANDSIDRAENERRVAVIDNLNSDMLKQIAGPYTGGKGLVQIEVLKELGTIVLRGKKEEVKDAIEVIEAAGTDSGDRIIRGKIFKINEAESTLLLTLGTENGLKKGEMLDVVRENKLLGRIKVVSVAPKDSIAEILTVYSEDSISRGDEVRVIRFRTVRSKSTSGKPDSWPEPPTPEEPKSDSEKTDELKP